MAEFLTEVGAALTGVLGFVPTVWDCITANPLMMLGVGGTAAGIGFKLLRKGKRAAK